MAGVILRPSAAAQAAVGFVAAELELQLSLVPAAAVNHGDDPLARPRRAPVDDVEVLHHHHRTGVDARCHLNSDHAVADVSVVLLGDYRRRRKALGHAQSRIEARAVSEDAQGSPAGRFLSHSPSGRRAQFVFVAHVDLLLFSGFTGC